VSIQLLKLETLTQLAHGKVGVAFDREIKRMIKDCLDRPSDERKRIITLTVEVTPTAVADGQVVTCEGAVCVAKVKSKLPDYESQKIDLGVRENGGAVFSPTCPENHRQQELFEPDELK